MCVGGPLGQKMQKGGWEKQLGTEISSGPGKALRRGRAVLFQGGSGFSSWQAIKLGELNERWLPWGLALEMGETVICRNNKFCSGSQKRTFAVCYPFLLKLLATLLFERAAQNEAKWDLLFGSRVRGGEGLLQRQRDYCSLPVTPPPRLENYC